MDGMFGLAMVMTLAMIADSAALTSASPSAHGLGLVVARRQVPVAADARGVDLQRVQTDAQAGGRSLADGSVALWHNPVRWGNHFWAREVPMRARVFGLNTVSAVVRRKGTVQEVEVRLRPSLIALALWCLALVGYGLFSGGAVVTLPFLLFLAAVVGGSTWWAYEAVNTYVSQVAPTT